MARQIVQYKTDHPSIKFTVELHKYNTLSFLDVLTRKKDNCYETDEYRKPTFTLLGLKFNRTISKTYKNNLVQCLWERTYKICSDQINFNSSLNKLRNFFYQMNARSNLSKKSLKVKFIC